MFDSDELIEMFVGLFPINSVPTASHCDVLLLHYRPMTVCQ